MNRSLAAAAAAAAIFGLTACGSDAPTAASTTSSTSSASSSSASSSSSSPSSATSSTTATQASPSRSSSSSAESSGAIVDDKALVALMKKGGCATAIAKPAKPNGAAVGIVSGVECKGEGTTELIGIRTKSPSQVDGAVRAMTASSAGKATVYYVKDSNWAVLMSDDGKGMPTRSGTEKLHTKLGAGQVSSLT